MKDWNRTAVIKAVIIAVFSLPNLFLPVAMKNDAKITDGLIGMIFFTIATFLIWPLVLKFRLGFFFGSDFEKPSWNDNPLSLKKPLRFIQFMAVFFVASGLTILLPQLTYNRLSEFGFLVLGYGIGTYLSMYLTLRWTRKN